MYGYINGTITIVESSYVIIDNNGIGYLVYVANPYSFEVGKEYRIYIYEQVREDEHTLYGFKEIEEKKLFLKLINVKGLGCKMALPMFATGSMDGIVDAIERENILYLKKFPKIGDKVARQIILDLKGKLAQSSTVSLNENTELIETLSALGYKQADIKRILPKINSEDQIEKQIKDALKLMLK
jgi:Holliday junction DNA helicase RuvA